MPQDDARGVPVQLTVHRGARTVGGTCVELALGGDRLVLDCGLPLFGPDRRPLDTRAWKRRTTDELREQGHLPPVPGLFDSGADPPLAVVLSHAHPDHAGLIERTDPRVPVHATRGTSKMLLAGALFAGGVALPRGRFRELTPGAPATIGPFAVTAHRVDHSAHDSAAILVEAAGKRLLYTGDLRLHGRKPEMHRDLKAALNGRPVDLLLTEATRAGDDDRDDAADLSEYELEEKLVRDVSAAPGLVLADFSPQHVDRLVAFLRAALRTGRSFVADPYAAFVLRLVAPDTPVPTAGQAGVRVFTPASMRDRALRSPKVAELLRRFDHTAVGVGEIIERPDRFLTLFRPSMLPDFGGDLPRGTLAVFSRWPGYLTAGYGGATEALDRCGGRLISLHASGHVRPGDLVRFVRDIGPTLVVPVHTFDPHAAAELLQNVTPVRVVGDGETLEV